MNNDELATVTADPIQVLGMSFYFDELTKVRGKEHGVNVILDYLWGASAQSLIGAITGGLTDFAKSTVYKAP